MRLRAWYTMPGTDLAYHPTRALYAFAEHPTDAANLNYDLHPLKVNSAICYAQTCAISGTDVAKLRYLLRTRRKVTGTNVVYRVSGF